jgi:hypothetical protein
MSVAGSGSRTAIVVDLFIEENASAMINLSSARAASNESRCATASPFKLTNVRFCLTLAAMSRNGAPRGVAIVGDHAPLNRRLLQFVRLATGLEDPIEVPAIDSLNPKKNPRVVLCWAADAVAVAARCREVLPRSKVVVWLPDPDVDVFEVASRNPSISCLIGWSRTVDQPSLWELGFSLRRLAGGDESLSPEIPLKWRGFGGTWYPQSTEDLFATLDEVSSVLGRAGLNARVGRRVVGVAHEMLMNALYDAPADDGKPRFAHDRTQRIKVAISEAPRFELRTDGLRLMLQVSDPFGRLRREHVYSSLVRGNRSRGASSSDEVIDTSGGGAGLGLHRIISDSNTTIFDVLEDHSTSVTSIFDLDQTNRERRREPISLLFFHRFEPSVDDRGQELRSPP